MAEEHFTRVCCDCGATFQRSGAGRPAHRCVACRTKNADRALSAGVRNCLRCGAEFSAKQNQKHCSDRCRQGTKLTRAEYLEYCKASAGKNIVANFVCLNCGKPSYRKKSGTNSKRGYTNKYCSMACLSAHAGKIRAEKEAAEKPALAFIQRVIDEVKALRRLGKATYKPTKKRCFCNKCGAMFIAKLGGGLYKQRCDECLYQAMKVCRKTAKAKRRAAYRGVQAVSVNPYKVFDRDKWRCQLCGKKTPKTKRGTLDDDAPELDHIIPISKGGPHTYENTQCACRKCNGLKGDKPAGQMLLLG